MTTKQRVRTGTALSIFLALAAFLSASPTLNTTVIACDDQSQQFTTTTSIVVSASGTTQAEALAELYGDGMADDFARAQDMECDSCASAKCAMTCDYSGTISGIHYLTVKNSQGVIVGYIAIAVYNGTYTLYCEAC
ncbi:MAG: hypothetical protein L6Q99_01525 [Planctomycetes bacterium]|nr:hypothetical protein [Planctomycetota bacterium]